ncbi:MAG: very short patch repair endonuclease [Chthoniobacterales bacterium]
MDVFSSRRRSEIMRRVRSKDTRPEIIVRKLIYRAGYRYRIHLKTVPGRPDIALRARKKAIFVNGCFWHGHVCPAGSLPKSNQTYWRAKQSRNAARDQENLRLLKKTGWSALTIWECQMKDLKKLSDRLQRFLNR